MNKTQELIDKGKQYFLPVYRQREFILSHGKGCRLYDIDDKEYIDFGAGIGVNALGHQHPKLLAALDAQSRKLWHTSNIFYSEPSIRLAEELVHNSFASKVFFSNSGTEAIEAAIKLARKYGKDRGLDKYEIITFENSFHGRTTGAITATGQAKYREDYQPLMQGFHYAVYNDIESVKKLISKKTCALIVEPVQGEGGINPATADFLKKLRILCDENDALLIFDQIQCGLGRTGDLFSHSFSGIEPDAITLAKALGGGFPIGALLVGEKAAETLQFGAHGTTFGGNPLACAVALAAFTEIKSASTLANVHKQAEKLRARLRQIGHELDCFSEIRGRGLMIGAALSAKFAGKAGDIGNSCRHEGVLILQAGPDVLRFLPPLVINDEELEIGLDRMEKGIKSFAKSL